MSNYSIKNDLLTISYYLDKVGWKSINKTNYQRILYFTAVLSPVFLKDYDWPYTFSNTLFGPQNKDITKELEVLFTRNLIDLEERRIISNRVEARYKISEKGKIAFKNTILVLDSEHSKLMWFHMVIKVLNLYGDKFLTKLIKEDPNISVMNEGNQNSRIPIGNDTDNLSKELLQYLKENGSRKVNLESDKDEEFLMLFFDLLYRKYKEEL
ncbi:MAG: hypothetical protein ACK5H4_07605 [Lacrimispora sphenoides]